MTKGWDGSAETGKRRRERRRSHVESLVAFLSPAHPINPLFPGFEIRPVGLTAPVLVVFIILLMLLVIIPVIMLEIILGPQ